MTNSTPKQADLQQRVTELESALCAQQRQLKELFDEAPAPYLVISAEGDLLEANAAACQLFKRTHKALLRQRLARHLAPDSLRPLTLTLAQVQQTGLTQQTEVKLLIDDVTVDALLSINILRGGVLQAKNTESYRIVMTQVSSYKQAHLTLLDLIGTQEAQLRAQLGWGRTLNQEVEQVMLALTEQLQTPVDQGMNVLGSVQQSLTDAPEEVTLSLSQVEQSFQQLTVLLTSITGYLQVRNMRATVQSVSLERLWQEVIKAAQPTMQERRVHLTHDSLPEIKGDRRQFSLILTELLSNALKFSRCCDVAHIHLHVRDQGHEYVFGIEDNGVGFNMRFKGKLFLLFGRLHSSQEYEGTGIGLLTVRRICERFGGRVWAEGKVNRGATVWVAWPKEPQLRT